MESVNVFIAGIGGQGSLLIGQILANVGIEKGYNATWVPIYGVEKRGGDATVMVIVSKDEIDSPILFQFDNMIVMHHRMWEKYKNRIKQGALLLVNESIVRVVEKDNYKYYGIPATEIALEIGDEIIANMVLLGAFLKLVPIFGISEVIDYVKKNLKKEELIRLNVEALERGYNYISSS
ncbi:MAG: 2-oxoacid:acceptor oxidoreductase family protein [Thermosulfidibacteraceae bacterium]|jgi:2-oxoglutarate ferredoxin oxidoreductase subunit gamma